MKSSTKITRSGIVRIELDKHVVHDIFGTSVASTVQNKVINDILLRISTGRELRAVRTGTVVYAFLKKDNAIEESFFFTPIGISKEGKKKLINFYAIVTFPEEVTKKIAVNCWHRILEIDMIE